ncbi:Transcription initiation factor TFIID subunit 2-like protein, partial [Dinothrombium tinctorium]
GLVELHVIPQKEDLKTIKVNCKQCQLFKITINDCECSFTYNDPNLDICQGETKQRNLDHFSSSHYSSVCATDPDKNAGEIIIQIPSNLAHYVAEAKTLKITIEFGVEKPLGGVHFVVPENDAFAHMFTYAHENSARLWFPSIDSFSEPCTWKMEFTVDASMIAVATGDLIETVFNNDTSKKTFHYQILIPTVAPAIGLAVGPFEIMVDPFMHEVTHFCLPHLLPLLKETCAFLHEAFEFYEELLSTRYPYPCYKQVFVDEAYCEAQSYATLAILDTNLLHSKHIIDQTYITRKILSQAIAQQFFGCFITMQSWSDAWLTRGISAFLASQYYKKSFGNNEYRYFVHKELNEVLEYEEKQGGIVLDPSSVNDSLLNNFYFSFRHCHTISPIFDEAHRKKSHLVIRMLEDRIGSELIIQVFNKLLSLAVTASQHRITANTSNGWNNMLLSTSSFTKAIFTVTGKDITTFLSQWVHQGGHPKFHGSFIFNRKRNTVELEIKQLETTSLGIRRYMGPLSVWVQELDGTFKQSLQIEETATKHDITCHSKSRRNKKKKIPLCTGEEVDMDLSNMDADSPVLWIRVDPNMQLLRRVVFEQPDYQWQYQLRYERDITAQIEAIQQLKKYPTPCTRKALTDTIENEQCFYRVRCAATECLKDVANQMAATWSGPPAMMTIFKKLFGSYSCPHIIKLNNFQNFQLYFLQKAMPVAMAGLRTAHGICPQEVLRFLLDLFKYNDNSKNKFSDNYYRAALIDALAETVTPIVAAVFSRSGLQQVTSEVLPPETKLILEEITRYLNLDKLLPCYRFVVTVSCLKAIRHMQKMGHLPSNPSFFREYAQYGVFIDVRIAAIEALVDITKAEQRREDFEFLLDLIETDPVSRVRYATLRFLVENPPFTKANTQSPLNTEDIVERIWRFMNNCLSHDSKLRCGVVDLYYTLFGRGRPNCLPKPELSVVVNLKEKKAHVNTPLETSVSIITILVIEVLSQKFTALSES